MFKHRAFGTGWVEFLLSVAILTLFPFNKQFQLLSGYQTGPLTFLNTPGNNLETLQLFFLAQAHFSAVEK